MKIEMKSDVYKVVEIKKPTKAVLFGEVKEGDLIQFKMHMENAGRASRGGTYASYVTVENLTQGTSTSGKSQTEVSNILSRSFVIEREDIK